MKTLNLKPIQMRRLIRNNGIVAELHIDSQEKLDNLIDLMNDKVEIVFKDTDTPYKLEEKPAIDRLQMFLRPFNEMTVPTFASTHIKVVKSVDIMLVNKQVIEKLGFTGLLPKYMDIKIDAGE